MSQECEIQTANFSPHQRLGMMILLGQHGQRQDFNTGLEYIRLAAQSCDQNAPQGAYVSALQYILRGITLIGK